MKLTPLGRTMAIVMPLIIATGIILGLVPLVMVGAFGLGLLMMATTIVAETPQFELERTATPLEVQRGRPSIVRIKLTSTSKRRPRALTIIESVAGEQRLASVPPILQGRSFETSYELPTRRRGVVVAGPMQARRFDPFGLITADRTLGETVSVSVRPAIHPVRMLPSGRLRDLEGPTRERSIGTAAFHQLREYVPGDDLRRVHWRSSARRGELLVAQMVDTTRPELVIVLDNRSSAIGEDDFESAVEIAASINRAAELENFPVMLLQTDGDNDLALLGRPVPSYDRLTAVQRSPGDSLAQLADVLRARGRSMVFITGELQGSDLVLVSRIMHGFYPAYLVSVVADRHMPVVAPPGVQAVACGNASEFVVHWQGLR